MLIGLLALGLLAGILGGMLSIGGEAVMVPLLVLAFGFTVHGAIGTSLTVHRAIASILSEGQDRIQCYLGRHPSVVLSPQPRSQPLIV